MTDYTELKRLAESLPQLPWSYEANGFILAWDGTERSRCENVGGFYYVCEGVSNFREYLLALEPAKVLALIAENDAARKELGSLRTDNAQLIYALKQQEQSYLVLRGERDRLRAEVAGLRTGYEAYEQVNAELKAEIESLRKERDARHPFKPFHEPAIGFTGCVICGVYTDHGGLPCPKTRATADAALGQGEQS